VNQPSPLQRSIASAPPVSPPVASTFAGSGHKTFHQPVPGISVPWKKPGIVVIGADLLSALIAFTACRVSRLDQARTDTLGRGIYFSRGPKCLFAPGRDARLYRR
jgi:hypothetical protein